jgi:tetratricopeptide (TPR) repeat protein
VSEDDLPALLSRARAAHEEGDLARAERLFTEALGRGADRYADVHHTLGVVYHSWGLYSKAKAAFEQALELNPAYTEAALNLSITYNDLGRYAEAQALLARAMPPRDGGLDALTRAKIANLHAGVGDAYLSAGCPAEAAGEYRRALGLRPGYADIRTKLADALAEQGQRPEAIEQLRLTLDERPGFVPALLKLALLERAEGRADAARAALETLLELYPEHERARAYLAML